MSLRRLPDAAFIDVTDAPSALAQLRDAVGIGFILPRRGFALDRGMMILEDRGHEARLRFYGTPRGLRQLVEMTVLDLRALLATAGIDE